MVGNISKESKRQIVMGGNLGIGIPPFFWVFLRKRERDMMRDVWVRRKEKWEAGIYSSWKREIGFGFLVLFFLKNNLRGVTGAC